MKSTKITRAFVPVILFFTFSYQIIERNMWTSALFAYLFMVEVRVLPNPVLPRSKSDSTAPTPLPLLLIMAFVWHARAGSGWTLLILAVLILREHFLHLITIYPEDRLA